MSQVSFGSLRLRLDDWRVSQHFKRVEATLRAQDVSHLSPRLQLARKAYLDWLHDYATRGVFPRNYERPGCSPCFIDRDGRECAVAHLVMVSGQTALAYKIAEVANYAYVPEMTFPELDNWAAQSGLRSEELALIQPGYYLTLTGSFLLMAIAAWTVGLIAFLLNRVQIARRQKGIILPLIGLVAAIKLLMIGLVCLENAAHAYNLGAHPDGFPYNLPLLDVPPLVLGVVISIGLALLTGALSFSRIQNFFSAKRQNSEHIIGDVDTLL